MALFDGTLLYRLGTIGLTLGDTAGAIARAEVDMAQFRHSLVRLGFWSMPVIVATALFVGGIMVVQSAPLLTRFGAESLLGWGAGFGIFREVGPVLTGLMISGRAGSNNTAELGTLKVTDQIDGLRALAISPEGYLIAPRVIALTLTTFFGTVIAMILALMGAALTGQILLGVDPVTFTNSLSGGLLGINDVAHGLLKAFCFGLTIAATSTAFGVHASGGPPGVGRAVSAAVVANAVLIFLMDGLISFAASGSS